MRTRFLWREAEGVGGAWAPARPAVFEGARRGATLLGSTPAGGATRRGHDWMETDGARGGHAADGSGRIVAERPGDGPGADAK